MRFASLRAAHQETSAASRGRIPARVVLLVAGDLISFLVFAGVGRQSHGEASGLAALGQIAITAFPFALGWYLVAPFVGAYRRSRTDGPRAMLMRTELSWVCAWPATLLLRWIFSADHRVPVSFAVVILLANAVFLGLWRTLFAFAERKAR
jgi:hypothetical protein